VFLGRGRYSAVSGNAACGDRALPAALAVQQPNYPAKEPTNLHMLAAMLGCNLGPTYVRTSRAEMLCVLPVSTFIDYRSRVFDVNSLARSELI
jgi:hypothetical protein